MHHRAEASRLTEPVTCYHCGEMVPGGLDLCVTIDDEERPMCCPGCQAVAELIAGSGLDSFYRQRTAYPERPQELSQGDEYNRVYDDPELARTFSTRDSEGLVSASLLLGGISCGACTWLIERATTALPGVEHALVNLQRARLDIRFDPAECRLSDIFTCIEQLGYRPRPYYSSTAHQQAMEERKGDLRRVAVAGLGMMQVGMFAIALHAGAIQGIEEKFQLLLRWVSLPVAGFVVVYSARPFFISAWRHLQRGALVMDLPVALAIGLAFAASTWGTVTGTGDVYFDSVVMFTFLLLLGRFIEQGVRQRQLLGYTDAESALPDAVTMHRNSQWVTVPRSSIHPGDLLLIRPGETIPVDARIQGGNSAVREDTFNGESLPRTVGAGDTVYAGTLNTLDALQAEVLVDYRDSRLAALQRSIDQAQSGKPRLAAMADRIASWFVAGVLLAAVATAWAWLHIAPGQALWVTLSVLMVSCPCALALATPTALTCTANALRARGILVFGENALEALPHCTHLVLDKTGTLTEGAPTVSRIETLGDLSREDILSIVAAMQQFTTHPMSSAFASIEAMTGFEGVSYRVGAGLEGHHRGEVYRAGSEAFCRELAPVFPGAPDGELYWFGLCRENEPLAWIGLSDRVRNEANALVADARSKGLVTSLLTGDSSPHAKELAEFLCIDKVATGHSPQQKMDYVKTLQAEGAKVIMVGDGLNDAPVLAQADVSFAVSSATDLARSQADFVLVKGDLNRIGETLRKAERCRNTVRQNFGWALGYNLCAMPLAAMGFVPPWAAAIGMSLSSLLVLGNSLRLTHSSRRT